jgi:hypothetical protein
MRRAYSKGGGRVSAEPEVSAHDSTNRSGSPRFIPHLSSLTFKPTQDEDAFVEDEYEFGRQITPYERLPEPKEWVDRFVHAALEILNGKRAPMQLSRWCNRKVFAYLTENARVRPATIRVGRKRICQPYDRVLVARFEGLDGRWLCVELYSI